MWERIRSEVRNEIAPAEELKTRKSRFKFSKVGIGGTIVFAPTGIEVKVSPIPYIPSVIHKRQLQKKLPGETGEGLEKRFSTDVAFG